MKNAQWPILLIVGLLVASTAKAQPEDDLCQNTLKPAARGMSLTWERFNDFGSLKESVVERGFAMTGEGSSCKLTSQRSGGTLPDRSCTWTPRLRCDLRMGQDPINHNFSTGSYQFGKLQWTGNIQLPVQVKRGDTITVDNREVAVVKFKGTWIRGQYRGDSESTAYFDRNWGVLLKVEGAHDANKWGDTVVLVEVQQY